jgi:hypothetical protein
MSAAFNPPSPAISFIMFITTCVTGSFFHWVLLTQDFQDKLYITHEPFILSEVERNARLSACLPNIIPLLL